MNVFTAVFKATEEDIERVKFEFTQEFGQEPWDAYIKRYLPVDKPGLLFTALETKYKYWVINALAEDAAKRTKEVYDVPPEFLALELKPENTRVCPRCGYAAQADFFTSTDKYGYPGSVCFICYSDVFETYLAGIKAETDRILAGIK